MTPVHFTPDELQQLWRAVEALWSRGRRHDAIVTLRAAAERCAHPAPRITLGALLAEQADYYEAISEWTRVIDEISPTGDRAALAAVYHNLAAVYRLLGDLKLARHFQQQSLRFQDEAGAEDLLQMAGDALGASQWALAETLLDAVESSSDDQEEIETDLLAQVTASRGLLDGFRGEPAAGIAKLRAAYHIHCESGHQERAGQDLINLAALLDQQGRAGLAIRCLRQARRTLQQAGEPVNLNRANYLLRKLERSQSWQAFDVRQN